MSEINENVPSVSDTNERQQAFLVLKKSTQKVAIKATSFLSVEKIYAKGGYMVFNYTDNIYASPETYKTRKEAKEFIKGFRKKFEAQGYYRDNRRNKINPEHIEVEVIPSDFNPFTS